MFKKGIFLFILLFIALIEIPEASIHADEVVIEVDRLNVRSGPGTNYEKIGQVHSNDTYSIVETKEDWVKIDWNSKKGWVAKWMVTITKEQNASVSSTFTAKVNYLRIRSEAGLGGVIKGYLMKGDQVKVEKQKGKWYSIKSEGKKGWVHGDYLSTSLDSDNSVPSKKEGLSNSDKATLGKIKIGTKVLNVRSSNSLNSKVLKQVFKGNTFDYIDEEDRWYQIKLSDGKTGWVAGWLV
ncbi:SH3 domain-containing protein, partial [Halobacillus sp. BBL2006]|uniref:SH3 domain-containing protein n=1 Tax=Halobacillus sp. BBL2006 TaxID=1543706 RepID=UPI00054264D8